MTDQIVINTGPILALSKMDAMDLIQELPFDIITPFEVDQEIKAGRAKGYEIETPSWIKILKLASKVSPLASASLDLGEAAVIQLALEKNIQIVCIDELNGRRAARAVGLRVIGSLGLLGRAKTLGLTTTIRPYIRRAIDADVYYDSKLVDSFLADFGE